MWDNYANEEITAEGSAEPPILLLPWGLSVVEIVHGAVLYSDRERVLYRGWDY